MLRSWSWWRKWFQKMFWHWGERFWSRKINHLFFQLTSSDSVVYGFAMFCYILCSIPPYQAVFESILKQLFVFTLSPRSMKARPWAPADSKAGTARTVQSWYFRIFSLLSWKVEKSFILVTFCGSQESGENLHNSVDSHANGTCRPCRSLEEIQPCWLWVSERAIFVDFSIGALSDECLGFLDILQCIKWELPCLWCSRGVLRV